MVATLHFRSAFSFVNMIDYCFKGCIQFKTKNVRSLINTSAYILLGHARRSLFRSKFCCSSSMNLKN